MFGREVLAISRMVGAACLDPGGAAGLHVGVGFPENAGYGQLWQLMGWRHGFYFVYEEAEAIAHVYDGGVDGGSGGGIEDEPDGVGFSADAQGVDLAGWLAGCDGLADLEHVCAEDHVI